MSAWAKTIEETLQRAPEPRFVMTSGDVAAHIERAFASTPYPGDAFDDISATQYDEDIVDYFRGTTWRGHRVCDLRYHSAALSFFTDSAFRYWLPAFMLAELEDPEEADTIGESIAYIFNNIKPERTEVFNQQELAAVAAFLRDREDWCEGDGIYDREFRTAAEAVERHLRGN